jgi:hypothetical protein
MAATVEERAKQEAGAWKARAWFRDMAAQVFGTGEYKEASGKPLKMRHELRDKRLDTCEKKRKSERIKQCGTLWSDVHSIEWVTTCDREARGRDEISDMVDMLMRQTPDLYNRFDELTHDIRFDHADVSYAALGAFKLDKCLEKTWQEHALPLPNAFKNWDME